VPKKNNINFKERSSYREAAEVPRIKISTVMKAQARITRPIYETLWLQLTPGVVTTLDRTISPIVKGQTTGKMGGCPIARRGP